MVMQRFRVCDHAKTAHHTAFRAPATPVAVVAIHAKGILVVRHHRTARQAFDLTGCV
ncbi:hypothetical protein [Actinokineospora inagensis]|uniref:hypothetical protein n=1 Tax=Actinokineospora inagensis TaxID=103730 RepID=UPI00040F4F0F|nr:hypothetical protein [Actinokineospora inagensis]